jgi:DNA-binding transcriptional MocR family regulator
MTTSTRPVRRQINLLRGWPSPSLHPTSQLESAAQTVLTTPSISIPALQYGPDPGYEPLRVAISSWLSNFYSSPTSLAPTSSQQEQVEGEVTDKAEKPVQEAVKTSLQNYSGKDDLERICITGGASQNLACALQVFTDPGVTRAIWMVAPCYFLACRIFEDAGFAGRLRAVREDEEGIDLIWLEREIEILKEKELQTEQKVSCLVFSRMGM